MPDYEAIRELALEWIYTESGGGQSRDISLHGFMAETGLELEEGKALVRDLADHGLVLEANRNGDACAFLTGDGARYVEQRRRQRQDPVVRATGARNKLLHYFYRQDLAGVDMPYTEGVLNTGDGRFGGVPFTSAEIDRAAEYLESKGLIKGVPVAELRGPVAARITSDGQDCMEVHAGDVADYLRNRPRRGSTSSIHIGTLHNSGALAVNSSGITQTVNVNDARAIAGMVNVLLNALPRLGLPSASEAALRAELVDVRRELESAEPQRNRIRAALARAAGYIGDTSKLINAGAEVAKAWDALGQYFS